MRLGCLASGWLPSRERGGLIPPDVSRSMCLLGEHANEFQSAAKVGSRARPFSRAEVPCLTRTVLWCGRVVPQPVIRTRTRTIHATEALARTARRGRAALCGWQRAAAAAARRRQTQAVGRLEAAATAMEAAKAAALQQVTVCPLLLPCCVSERRQRNIHQRVDTFGLPVLKQGTCVCLCVCVRERETATSFPWCHWINRELERRQGTALRTTQDEETKQ